MSNIVNYIKYDALAASTIISSAFSRGVDAITYKARSWIEARKGDPFKKLISDFTSIKKKVFHEPYDTLGPSVNIANTKGCGKYQMRYELKDAQKVYTSPAQTLGMSMGSRHRAIRLLRRVEQLNKLASDIYDSAPTYNFSTLFEDYYPTAVDNIKGLDSRVLNRHTKDLIPLLTTTCMMDSAIKFKNLKDIKQFDTSLLEMIRIGTKLYVGFDASGQGVYETRIAIFDENDNGNITPVFDATLASSFLDFKRTAYILETKGVAGLTNKHYEHTNEYPVIRINHVEKLDPVVSDLDFS